MRRLYLDKGGRERETGGGRSMEQALKTYAFMPEELNLFVFSNAFEKNKSFVI